MRAASILVFLALAAAAAAATLTRSGGQGAEVSAVSATGGFSLSNSREGMPVFSAADLAPGDSSQGVVEIGNGGDEPAELTLTQHDVVDSPGGGGGLLSGRISVLVRDVTVPADPNTVYAGRLAPMPARDAGVLEPGQTRRFEFVATLPDGGGGENDVQGAKAEVAYSWIAAEASPRGPAPGPGEVGSGPNGGSEGTPGASPSPPEGPLVLEIRDVKRTIRHGRLIVLAGCNRPCRISVRGRLWANAGGERRGVSLRLAPRAAPAAGSQRLEVGLPRRLRSWLRLHRAAAGVGARLLLRAQDSSGGTATAHRVVRLRAR